MKSAKIFLAGMYLHLVLSIGIPLGIFSQGSWNSLSAGLLMFYLAAILAVQVAGWACVGMAAAAYRHNKGEELKKGWKLLKLASIPFYIFNFFYSYLAWMVLIGASRGLMALFLPIPIFVTCLMVFQSGCVGICHVMDLRRQAEKSGNPSRLHYLLQLVPVLDIISVILLMRADKDAGEKERQRGTAAP